MTIKFSRLILNVSTMNYEWKEYEEQFNNRDELYKKYPDAVLNRIKNN